MNAIALVGFHIIYFFGAIILLVFFFDHSRRHASWAHWLGLVAILLLMVLAVSGFALDFHMSLPISSNTLRVAESFVRGIVLGLLIALVASGELVGQKKSDKIVA